MSRVAQTPVEGFDENPYLPPVADVKDLTVESSEQQLAGRLHRLIAALIDALTWSMVGGVTAWAARISAGAGANWEDIVVYSYGISGLILLAINFYLLHRNGQTIGKLAVTIKIVCVDGSRAGLARLFLVRTLLTWIMYGVPLLNILFFPLDVLFIFRRDRRCLHDLIAGTKVVRAN
jgi:uncharacterized RDD family membrane protein YckC